jgi:hypothetical protein
MRTLRKLHVASLFIGGRFLPLSRQLAVRSPRKRAVSVGSRLPREAQLRSCAMLRNLRPTAANASTS